MHLPEGATKLANLRREWRGDFSDREVVDGQLPLGAQESATLAAEATRFAKERGGISALQRGGHPVATVRKTGLLQWTSVSRIVNVSGKRVFLLYKFPGSWLLRLIFTLRFFRSGIPLYRTMGTGWKRTIESRTVIPFIPLAHPHIVAMPYIDSVSIEELIGGTAAKIADEELLQLFEQVAKVLATAHAAGIVWGDPTTHNIIVDAERRAMLVDMEMLYIGISPDRQRQLDVRRFVDEAYRAMAAARGWNDRSTLEARIMTGYRAGMPSTS